MRRFIATLTLSLTIVAVPAVSATSNTDSSSTVEAGWMWGGLSTNGANTDKPTHGGSGWGWGGA